FTPSSHCSNSGCTTESPQWGPILQVGAQPPYAPSFTPLSHSSPNWSWTTASPHRGPGVHCGVHSLYSPVLPVGPSSQSSPGPISPSPQSVRQSLGPALKPESVSLYVEPVFLRSAWKTLTSYTLPGSRPKAATVDMAGSLSSLVPSVPWIWLMLPLALIVKRPSVGTCRPPRSTASRPLTKTHMSSSPMNDNS